MGISANVQWEVRSTGNDANGGGFLAGATGTDFSQQNSAQVAYTDLVIGATNTQLTSAAHPFSSTAVGNIINVISGTGFTPEHYQVISVSGVIAIMDRAVGTASSTGGVGNLGGCKATIGAAAVAVGSGNTVWVKAATYTVTTSITQRATAPVSYVGYSSARGDNGQPTVTTATNSVNLFSNVAGSTLMSLSNFILTTTAATVGVGLINLSTAAGTIINVKNCSLTGFAFGIAASGGISGQSCSVAVLNCSILNTVENAICSGGSFLIVVDSTLNGTTTATGLLGALIQSGSVMTLVSRCLVVNATLNSGIVLNNGVYLNVIDSTIAFNHGQGISGFSNTSTLVVQNCVIYGNGLFGVITGANSPPSSYVNFNAVGSNASGNYSHIGPGANDVALTANPFTNSAGGDFSLNTTVGGGASCKGTGYPGVFPGGTTTGNADIGAVQSTGGAGSGAYSSIYLS